MRVTDIKYLRRFNLGSYEHEEIEMHISLDDGEKALDAIRSAKVVVNNSRAPKNKVEVKVNGKQNTPIAY